MLFVPELKIYILPLLSHKVGQVPAHAMVSRLGGLWPPWTDSRLTGRGQTAGGLQGNTKKYPLQWSLAFLGLFDGGGGQWLMGLARSFVLWTAGKE